MTHRVLGIAGWKNSGKTTLAVHLVEELTGRGWQVSTIKHAHHDADVDHPGTDSFRHRQAGAREVLLATGRRWALMHELKDEAEPALDVLLARLAPCDLVVVEGFKTSPHPKIETRRRAAKDRAPLPASANVIAIATDIPTQSDNVPQFDLNDVTAIADFVEQALDMKR